MPGSGSVEAAVRQYVEAKSGFANESRKARMVDKIFQEFDRDGSGQVDEEEFLAGLVRMNIVGCTEECLDLFDKLDPDMSGAISYAEFAAYLFPGGRDERAEEEAPFGRGGVGRGGAGRGGKNGAATATATAAGGRAAREGQDVVARVKARILELAGAHTGIRGATRVLRKMDTDGSNSLNASELKEGMLSYGVSLTPAEVRTLMQYFDRDGSGKITIEEFLRGLRGEMGRARRRLVRSAWEQLVSHLEMDGPNDVITLKELGSFYDVRKNPAVMDGGMTEEQALRLFMSHWDKDHDDKVSWKEFLDYYGDLSAGIERDDYFELMIRNAWHLSGGEGWAENTTNIRCLVTFLNGDQKVVELKDDFGVQHSVGKQALLQMLAKQGVKDVSDAKVSDK
jgi:Ca2+-binding EF-hand superfamily protein